MIIQDNDDMPAVSFKAATYEMSEDVVTATLTVELSGPSGFEVRVDYATVDDTASAGSDYLAANGTLSFLPGDALKTITVTILNDDLSEDTERLVLRLSNPLHSMLGAYDEATLQILDDDGYMIFLPLIIKL